MLADTSISSKFVSLPWCRLSIQRANLLQIQHTHTTTTAGAVDQRNRQKRSPTEFRGGRLRSMRKIGSTLERKVAGCLERRAKSVVSEDELRTGSSDGVLNSTRGTCVSPLPKPRATVEDLRHPVNVTPWRLRVSRAAF